MIKRTVRSARVRTHACHAVQFLLKRAKSKTKRACAKTKIKSFAESAKDERDARYPGARAAPRIRGRRAQTSRNAITK